jgi:hypothetical protein
MDQQQGDEPLLILTLSYICLPRAKQVGKGVDLPVLGAEPVTFGSTGATLRGAKCPAAMLGALASGSSSGGAHRKVANPFWRMFVAPTQ